MLQLRNHSLPALMALAAIVSLLLPGGLGEGAGCRHHGAIQVQSVHGEAGGHAKFERDYDSPSIGVNRGMAPQAQGSCPFCAPSLNSLEAPNNASIAEWGISKASLKQSHGIGVEAPRPPPLLNAPKQGPPSRA